MIEPTVTAAGLESALREFLSRNHGPGYRVTVTRVEPDASAADVTLVFESGKTYCCAEPFCHVPPKLGEFIRFAAERSVPLPDSFVIRWHCRVEQGAKLEVLRAFGRPIESDAYEFDAASGA
jgi:hypothetical protein